MRAIAVGVSLLFVFVPAVVAGQTSTAASPGALRNGAERLSLQVVAGPTTMGGGNAQSASFGYSPVSRLEFLVTVERIHLPFEMKHFVDGYSVTRGGTMTFAGGELRIALRPADRVSPFVMVGGGGGISRPNVNAEFPDPVRNDVRVGYVGGGVRVPLRRGFSLLADARAMLALEGYDGVMAVVPVRAGVAWRF